MLLPAIWINMKLFVITRLGENTCLKGKKKFILWIVNSFIVRVGYFIIYKKLGKLNYFEQKRLNDKNIMGKNEIYFKIRGKNTFLEKDYHKHLSALLT